jgi:hypothetical protein
VDNAKLSSDLAQKSLPKVSKRFSLVVLLWKEKHLYFLCFTNEEENAVLVKVDHTTSTVLKNCMRRYHSFFCAGIEPGHAGEGRQIQRKGTDCFLLVILVSFRQIACYRIFQNIFLLTYFLHKTRS